MNGSGAWVQSPPQRCVCMAVAGAGSSGQRMGRPPCPFPMQTLCSGVTMGETLRRLGPSLELAPMQQSAFVKPHSIMFQLDGEDVLQP